MIRKLVHLIHRLETDATWQFNFHGAMTAIWIFGILTVPAFFWPRYPEAWAQLFLLEISLWANAMTHFGALSGALAAIHTEEPRAAEKTPGEADMWFDESQQLTDAELAEYRRRFLYDRDGSEDFHQSIEGDWDFDEELDEDALINAVDDKPLKVRSDVSHLQS